MKIRVSVDPALALAQFDAAAERQLPYAVSLALNRTANLAQQAERDRIKTQFTLRHETFVLRGVKIAKQDRATKTSWVVTIQLAYPAARHFMDLHEPGGQRVRHGGKRLWQPNPKVFNSKIIGRSNQLHPAALALHRTAGGRIHGAHGTFVVRSGSQVLVLQRVARALTSASKRRLGSMTLDNVAVGMGPHMKRTKGISRTDGTRLLYRLVSSVRIPARLEFVRTMTHTAQVYFPSELSRAMAEAMRGAR